MQPSRIVKSAYRQAVKAGFKGSLKEWTCTPQSNYIADAIGRWLNAKDKMRKPSLAQRCAKGHHDVHTMTNCRSTCHVSGSPSVSLRGSL